MQNENEAKQDALLHQPIIFFNDAPLAKVLIIEADSTGQTERISFSIKGTVIDDQLSILFRH